MTGKINDRTVTTKSPNIAGMEIDTHEIYIRYLHPYLSQQTVKKTPNRLIKLDAINSP